MKGVLQEAVATGMETIMNNLSTFVSGLIDIVASLGTDIMANDMLSIFVFIIPLAAMALGWLFSIIGKKKRKR